MPGSGGSGAVDWPIPPGDGVDIQAWQFQRQFPEARLERYWARGTPRWPPGGEEYTDVRSHDPPYDPADATITSIVDNGDGSFDITDNTAHWRDDRWTSNPDDVPWVPTEYDLCVEHVGGDGAIRSVRFQITASTEQTITAIPSRNYVAMRVISSYGDLASAGSGGGDSYFIVRRDQYRWIDFVFGRWWEEPNAWIFDFGIIDALSDHTHLVDTDRHAGRFPWVVDRWIHAPHTHKPNGQPVEPGNPSSYDVIWFGSDGYLQRGQIIGNTAHTLHITQDAGNTNGGSGGSAGANLPAGAAYLIIGHDVPFYGSFSLFADAHEPRKYKLNLNDTIDVGGAQSPDTASGNKAHRIYNQQFAFCRGAVRSMSSMDIDGTIASSLMPAYRIVWQEGDPEVLCEDTEHPGSGSAADVDVHVEIDNSCQPGKADKFYAPDLFKTWRGLQVDRYSDAITNAWVDPTLDYDFLSAVEPFVGATFFNAAEVNGFETDVVSHTVDQLTLASNAPYDAEAIGLGLTVDWALIYTTGQFEGRIFDHGTGTLTDPGGSAGSGGGTQILNTSSTFPDTPTDAIYPSAGYDDGIVSGVDQYLDSFGLKDPFYVIDQDLKLVISPGHTRRYPRRVLNPHYKKKVWIPTVTEDLILGETIYDPPVWSDPGGDDEVRAPGSWTTLDVSTNFAEYNPDTEGSRFSFIQESGPDMYDGNHEGEIVRDVGINRGDGFLEDLTDGDSGAVAEYKINLFNGVYQDSIQREIDGHLAGIVSDSRRNYIEDNTQHWWALTPRGHGDQSLSTYLSGTATGGSATTLIDSTRTGSPFWEADVDGFVDMILEVDISSVTYYLPIIAAVEATHTLTFATPPDAPGGWTIAGGTVYRVRWPKYEANRLGYGRQLRLIYPNSTTKFIDATLSDDQRIYFAVQAEAPPVGSAYQIVERRPGLCWMIRTGSGGSGGPGSAGLANLIKPPVDEIDPRGGHFWPKDATKILETYATRYGFDMIGDAKPTEFFEEQYRAENILIWWRKDGAWTSRHAAATPEYNARAGRANWNESNPTYPDLYLAPGTTVYPGPGYSDRAACVAEADRITALMFNSVTPNSSVHGDEPAVQVTDAATWLEANGVAPQSVRQLSGHDTYYEGSVSRGHDYDDQQGGRAAEQAATDFAYAKVIDVPTILASSVEFRALAKRPGWESEFVELPTPIWRHDSFDFGSGPVADRVHTYIKSTFDANGSTAAEDKVLTWDATGVNTQATRVSAALGNNDLPDAVADAPIQSFYGILFADTPDIDQDFSDVIALRGWVAVGSPICIIKNNVAGGMTYINRLDGGGPSGGGFGGGFEGGGGFWGPPMF